MADHSIIEKHVELARASCRSLLLLCAAVIVLITPGGNSQMLADAEKSANIIASARLDNISSNLYTEESSIDARLPYTANFQRISVYTKPIPRGEPTLLELRQLLQEQFIGYRLTKDHATNSIREHIDKQCNDTMTLGHSISNHRIIDLRLLNSDELTKRNLLADTGYGYVAVTFQCNAIIRLNSSKEPETVDATIKVIIDEIEVPLLTPELDSNSKLLSPLIPFLGELDSTPITQLPKALQAVKTKQSSQQVTIAGIAFARTNALTFCWAALLVALLGTFARADSVVRQIRIASANSKTPNRYEWERLPWIFLSPSPIIFWTGALSLIGIPVTCCLYLYSFTPTSGSLLYIPFSVLRIAALTTNVIATILCGLRLFMLRRMVISAQPPKRRKSRRTKKTTEANLPES